MGRSASWGGVVDAVSLQLEGGGGGGPDWISHVTVRTHCRLAPISPDIAIFAVANLSQMYRTIPGLVGRK